MDIAAFNQELNELTTLCHSRTLNVLDRREQYRVLARLTQMQDQLHGLAMEAAVEADDSKAHVAFKSRSLSLHLAGDQRMNGASAGRVVNQAHTAIERLPLVHASYVDGRVTRDQLNLLTRVADDPKFRKLVGNAQPYFLSLTHLSYPMFRTRVEEWCEENDPTDPSDLDAKAHDDRKLVWAQGLGRTMLGELNLPNAEFDQLMGVLEPIYDTLIKNEFRSAAERAGLDEGLSDKDLEKKIRLQDLDRTGQQRWMDSLMIAMRAAGVVNQPALAKLANGETLSLEDIDPGALVQLVIVCDQETLEREIAEQNGETLQPRTNESLAKRRCETLSGKSLSPQTVLMLAQISSFRRMILAKDDLDFKTSRSARFFPEAMRQGLVIRDRFCATPGCGVSAHKCEADHIEQAAHGGETSPANGRMRCPACHRHKTRLQSMGLWNERLWQQQVPTERAGPAESQSSPPRVPRRQLSLVT